MQCIYIGYDSLGLYCGGNIEMIKNTLRLGPHCSPHPIDMMAIYALYQSVP